MPKNACRNLARELLLSFSYSLPFLILFVLVVLLWPTTGWPRDLGQWNDVDPAISTWYRSLMQPDTVGTLRPISCCGEGDAYWADEANVDGDKVIATITDDREDRPLGRSHVPMGTKYVIPPNKITRIDGNPTGHVIIFLGTVTWVDGEAKPGNRAVLCYVMNGGV